MTEIRNQPLPRARQERLVVRELSGELLVYDLDRNKAHCLNQTAALVWKRCDGQTSIAEMCRVLEEATGAPVEEQVIWFALDQFTRDHLLEKRVNRPADVHRLSRRALIQRVGLAVSIPLVVSVIAPTVFASASCTQSCTIVAECTVPGCTGSCSGIPLTCGP